ncbi:B-4DMT family transporter [Gordonia sp. X0973]|uniref:B-4DMT family transporter n=1 Tax=Gordonia sp. X0973 TaxID=2742602 RepID=UPI0013EA9FD1|nr:B-4DMT family transporter [Gordonia sp. X0973]QKT07273.1 B-4DMT family transporter [Gordonia sp. X0973]
MNSWILRGVSMGAFVTVAWVLVGVLMHIGATAGTIWSTIALALIVLVALLWGGYDGIRDARANQDPDDYADLTMVWLKAGFLSAVIAAVIGWIVGSTIVPGMGPAPLFVALTAGISFLTLLVYVPAFIGVSIGRWLVRREERKAAARAEEQVVVGDGADLA